MGISQLAGLMVTNSIIVPSLIHNLLCKHTLNIPCRATPHRVALNETLPSAASVQCYDIHSQLQDLQTLKIHGSIIKTGRSFPEMFAALQLIHVLTLRPLEHGEAIISSVCG